MRAILSRKFFLLMIFFNLLYLSVDYFFYPPNIYATSELFPEYSRIEGSVNFSKNSYNLTDDAIKILQDKCLLLKEYFDIRVIISGHCDERGSEKYNYYLGLKRAHAVKEYIIKMGINESRLDIISYGEQRPLTILNNEEGWSKNRRVDFEIIHD